MPARQFLSRLFSIAVAVLGLWLLFPAAASAATDPSAGDDGMEVLTRGPIHEAFADVGVNEAIPGTVIRRIVPEPITEVPPDYRPEGDNVQWISGYWSFDDEQNDFVWVSGIWRDVPPGRQWIPGYWMAVEGGSRFVSGYWTEIDQPETVYLPPPPEPLAAVPASSIASPDTLWIDGHWLWSGSGYVWQAGYWMEQRPDMIWIPAHYVWTPRGHVFVRGYWDYHFHRRGLLFAPRYYPRPSYSSHEYHYTPSIALNIDSIFLSLFIRKHHHHYYFGDYFDRRYERRGYLPWYSKHVTRYGHDPCYRGYRWHKLRENKLWEHNYHQQYQFRRDHIETRPPPLYRSQANHNSGRSLSPPDQLLGRPLAEVVEKWQAGYGDDRRTSFRQRAESGPRDRQQEVSQPVRPVYTGKSGDQPQVRQQKNTPGTVEKKRHFRPRSEQPSIPVHRVDNQSGNRSRFSQHISEQTNQSGEATSRKFSKPRTERQGTQLRARRDQPDFQPRVQQQRRSVQKVEDRSRSRTQDYRQTVTPRKFESQRSGPAQVTEKRRQYRRDWREVHTGPRIDQQRSRSTKFTGGQKSGSPRINQFTGPSRHHAEQMRGQPQVSEQNEKRQNRSGEHRWHRNR